MAIHIDYKKIYPIGTFAICQFCEGTAMVCEDHPYNSWSAEKDCCGGAGMPCECIRKNNDIE